MAGARHSSSGSWSRLATSDAEKALSSGPPVKSGALGPVPPLRSGTTYFFSHLYLPLTSLQTNSVLPTFSVLPFSAFVQLAPTFAVADDDRERRPRRQPDATRCDAERENSGSQALSDRELHWSSFRRLLGDRRSSTASRCTSPVPRSPLLYSAGSDDLSS